MEYLDLLINKKNINEEDLKFLAFLILKETKMFGKVNYKFYKKKSDTYGYAKPINNFEDYVIGINLLPFLNDKLSVKERLFDFYLNVVHEIEHTKTLLGSGESDFVDYNHLVVLMEYLSAFKNIDINKKNFEYYTSIINLNKYMLRNYSFSTSEMKSKFVSYSKAIEMFSKYLSKEETMYYLNLVQKYELLLNSIEIVYINGVEQDKFYVALLGTNMFIRHNEQALTKFPMLNLIFNQNNDVYDIYELYIKRNAKTAEFYDKLIIELLLRKTYDYETLFQDIDFKYYIENLISEYNKKVITYYKNIDELSKLVKNKCAILDNFKLLKNNSEILNNLIEKYNLKRKSGFVLSFK